MTNQRRMTALVVITVAAVIAAGGLMASNMGFKLNYPLVGANDPGSNSGRQAIGLPYNRQVGVDMASDLLADVNASGITALQIEKFDIASDSNAPYPGGVDDFALAKAEGYLLRTQDNGDYIIVGSHDPGFTVNLKAAEGTCPGVDCVSNSGRNRYAHPYHGVSSTAAELLAELAPDGLQIERFEPGSDSNSPYPGGVDDFDLVPGASYLVRVLNDKSFSPAHY